MIHYAGVESIFTVFFPILHLLRRDFGILKTMKCDFTYQILRKKVLNKKLYIKFLILQVTLQLILLMEFIPLFTRFYTSQVVGLGISSINWWYFSQRQQAAAAAEAEEAEPGPPTILMVQNSGGTRFCFGCIKKAPGNLYLFKVIFCQCQCAFLSHVAHVCCGCKYNSKYIFALVPW